MKHAAAPRLPARHVSRHGKVTGVSMMKDEGPFLLEWVAHHLAIGFTDLVVFTNDCTDGTDDMLIRLQDLGLAHHRRNVIPEGIKPQPSAIKHAQVEPEVTGSDWVLLFDADEFLCIKHGDGTLDTLIDAIEAEGANGMVITWRIFGSGGVQHWSRDFVTEQYLMAAPPMWNKGWGVKTLFKFDAEAWKLGIHRPKMKNKVLDTGYPDTVKWLNGSGREMEEYFKFRGWRSILRTVGYDWAQMNHYAVKSIDSYAMRKFRGNVNNKKNKYDDDYWALQDRNEVRDEAMLAYSDRRRAIFAGLLTDPVLSRLHFAALDQAEARLAEFKDTPEYDEFVDKLKAAAEVPITQVEARPPKARDPEKIAAKMSEVEKKATVKRQDEKAKAPQDAALAPVDLFVQGPWDFSAEVAMDWAGNHSVKLPADPRLFTPPALVLVAEGKFQRNLARNFPKLVPEFGSYLEIGATTGFVAAHMANLRPDMRIAAHQADAELRRFIAALWAANGLAEGERLALLDAPDPGDAAALGVLLATRAPDLLALDDPAVTAEVLDTALGAMDHPPARIALTGRLWIERAQELPAYERLFRRLGYTGRLPLDPTQCAAYERREPLEADAP